MHCHRLRHPRSVSVSNARHSNIMARLINWWWEIFTWQTRHLRQKEMKYSLLFSSPPVSNQSEIKGKNTSRCSKLEHQVPKLPLWAVSVVFQQCQWKVFFISKANYESSVDIRGTCSRSLLTMFNRDRRAWEWEGEKKSWFCRVKLHGLRGSRRISRSAIFMRCE